MKKLELYGMPVSIKEVKKLLTSNIDRVQELDKKDLLIIISAMQNELLNMGSTIAGDLRYIVNINQNCIIS